jgi:cobalt-zinc-cadmium efflux system membrane fusion protein
MAARLGGWLAKYQQRFVYLLIVGVLLAILASGHATHWSFHLPEGIMAAATTLPEKPAQAAPPVVPAKTGSDDPNELVLSDDVVKMVGIEVQPSTKASVRQTIEANGSTAYNDDAVAKLSVRVPGHVWRVEKRVGEEVKQGECLAVIDAVQVGEAKTALLQALVDLELKNKSLERLRRVAGEVAEKSIREAEANAREARLRVLSAQQKLINFGLPLHSGELVGLDDETLAERIHFLGIPDSIRGALDPHTTTANLIPLTAPFGGVVTERSATIGEIVTPDTTQFVVADVSRMWILLDVRKEDAASIRLGQAVEFQPDGATKAVAGRVDWISTELDRQTRTLRVRAEVANPVIDGAAGAERLLRANTYGVGRIVLRESSASVVVPSAAVQFDGRNRFVFVRLGDKFLRRDVAVGVAGPDVTEIVSGLAVGELVAVAGSHVLKAEFANIAAE